MKNYFEKDSRIVPFENVIFIDIQERTIEVEIERYTKIIFPIVQLDDYKQWLQLQLAKDLAIANYSEIPTSSEKPNRLTSVQLQKIIRVFNNKPCRDKCYKHNCDYLCEIRYTPSADFVSEVNKLLEEK